MSTQEDQGIAFRISHDQQKIRLLELPSSLLDSVTSGAQSRLWLKSTPPVGANPGNAVLCSDNQTFQIRQVHSSNSIFVLQPSNDEELTAIAKCEATLEAIPQTIPCAPMLEVALPVYSSLEDAKIPALHEPISKHSLLADMPVSYHEFNQTWREICAFEFEGQAWRPAPNVLWKTWISIVSACTIKGWSLDQPLNMDSLARTVEEDDIPSPLLDAVIDRMRADDGVVEQGHADIDITKCIYWTGIVCLQATPSNTLIVSDFLGDWRDHLPESWRRHATLDALIGSYIQPSKDTISFNAGRATPGAGTSSGAQVKATGPQARKWHEKFKSTRR